LIITIYAPPKEHDPPHFHVRHGAAKAVFDISDGSLSGGILPRRCLALIARWYALHADELQAAWDSIRSGTAPRKIAPLD
jgi:hypothetical protein